jgi:hypothetical protein
MSASGSSRRTKTYATISSKLRTDCGVRVNTLNVGDDDEQTSHQAALTQFCICPHLLVDRFALFYNRLQRRNLSRYLMRLPSTLAESRHETCVEAKAALFNYKQSTNQSTHDYRDTFKELLSVLESYGGKLHDPIEAVLNVLTKASVLNDNEKDALKRDHYAAALLIRNSDGTRYGPLRDALSNSFILGRGEYPTSLVDAYSLLLSQKGSTAQSTDRSPKNGCRGNGRSGNRDGRGYQGRGHSAGRSTGPPSSSTNALPATNIGGRALVQITVPPPTDKPATDRFTSENPSGTLTNSDLEQLALVCHPNILVTNHDTHERTICVLSDNTAAVSRKQHSSTSTDAPAAYLCRIAALHQRENRYRLTSTNLPGMLNVMADDPSRRWDLDYSQLLAYFNSNYPPWQLCTPWPAMISSMMQALSMQRCDPVSLMAGILPRPRTGPSGKAFVNNLAWAPTLPKTAMQSSGSRFLLCEYKTAGFPPPIKPSELQRWRQPSLSLRRRTQWLDCPTRVSSRAQQ